VYPRKSNSPSGTLQMRVFSSLTVSFRIIARVAHRKLGGALVCDARHIHQKRSGL
jgi:hypothetical protein